MYYILIFLCLASVFSEILGPPAQDAINKCNTTVCKLASANLLSSMNHFADPCEEFHEFVCGNKDFNRKEFSHTNSELIERYLKKNVNDQSKKVLVDFRKFYESCVNFDPSFDFIENIKFMKKYTSTNLTGVFTESVLTQSMPFFDVGMNIRSEDGSYIFEITWPGRSSLKTSVEHWSVFQQVESECEEHLEKSILGESVDLNDLYRNFEECKQNLLLDYARTYREDMQFALNISNYKNMLEELLASLKNIASYKSPNTDNYTEMSINELSQKYGVIEWKIFFEGLASRTFSGDEVIEVHNPEYLKKAFDLMKKYDERALVEMLQDFSSFQLYKNLFRVHYLKKLFCMDLSQQLMPDIATLIMYEVKNPRSTYTSILHTKRLFNTMKETLRHSILDSTLDSYTKSSFELKLSELELGLITSGNSNGTESNYMDVVVSKNYKENVLTLLKNYRNMLFSLVKSKSSAATLLNYFVSPFINSPKTFYTSNFIVLHPSLFDRIPAGYPEYIEVAKLGLLLAQGIAKHFDATGRLFRTDDSLQTDAYYSTITVGTNNLLDSFYLKSPYKFHGTFFEFESIDGSAFIDEMIVDNTAFRMVTDYLDSMDERGDQLPWISDNIPNNQIFIIAAAQELCQGYTRAEFIRDLYEKRRLPLPIKIQNMMSNSQYFSDAYPCTEGAAMDLDDSLRVQFPYKSADLEYEYEEVDSTRVTDY